MIEYRIKRRKNGLNEYLADYYRNNALWTNDFNFAIIFAFKKQAQEIALKLQAELIKN